MKIEIGYRLPTKDGRNFGNAQVIGGDSKEGWIVRTDYGNVLARKSVEELEYLFHPSFDECPHNPPHPSPRRHVREQIVLLNDIDLK